MCNLLCIHVVKKNADSLSGARNAIALEPRNQCAARDAQPARGLRLIASTRCQRIEDACALERIDAVVQSGWNRWLLAAHIGCIRKLHRGEQCTDLHDLAVREAGDLSGGELALADADAVGAPGVLDRE